MKILVVEPEKAPYTKDISGTLDSMQEIVGGLIQAVYPFDDAVALVCNDEGKLMGLPLNRALYDGFGNIYDIISGTFFLCGLSDNNFSDLPDGILQKYEKWFRAPEVFARVNGKIVAFK